MAELAVTALGADRPGIIARVTEVLRDAGGNLLDSSMTILGGHFAIVLLVDTAADAMVLEAEMARATAELGLVVAVRPVGPRAPDAAGGAAGPATHVLSVYGADRPGIVHAVTAALAQRLVNVTDLSTRLVDGASPLYAMLLEVRLPAGVEPEELARKLREHPVLAGVEVSLRPLEADTL